MSLEVRFSHKIDEPLETFGISFIKRSVDKKAVFFLIFPAIDSHFSKLRHFLVCFPDDAKIAHSLLHISHTAEFRPPAFAKKFLKRLVILVSWVINIADLSISDSLGPPFRGYP